MNARTRAVLLVACLAVAAAGAGALGLGAVAGDGSRADQVLPYGEVSWRRGYVKISAIGLPPFGAAGALTPEEVARQNAVSLAQKRLLGVLLDLDVRDRKLRDHLGTHPELKARLRQLVGAARVEGRSYSDGSVEITLTLPTEGPGGLRAFLADM